MTWKHGGAELDVSVFAPDTMFLVESAIENCAENTYGQMTLLSLLYPVFTIHEGSEVYLQLDAVVQKSWLRVMRMVGNHLKPGMSFDLCGQTIRASAQKVKTDINPYEKEYWSEDSAALIEALDVGSTLGVILHGVFHALSAKRDFETELINDLFDVPALLDALSEKDVSISLFGEDLLIREEALSLSAGILMESALMTAAEGGMEETLLLHILYALLEDKDGYAMQVLRMVSPAIPELAAARNRIRALVYRRSTDAFVKLLPQRSNFHAAVIEMLEAAAENATALGEKEIDDRQLFIGLLRSRDAGTRSVVESVLHWPVEEIIKLAEKTRWDPLYVRLPTELCECSNFSLEGTSRPFASRSDITNDIIKVLYRKDCHNAAIYGERGVGKTAVARLLAEELRNGSAAALRITPIIYLDANSLPDEQIETRTLQILTYMEEHPRPIYVIDGFTAMLAASFKACMRRLVKNEYKLVVILDGEGKKMLDKEEIAVSPFRLVEISEPRGELVTKMIEARIPHIEAEFGVTFDEGLANYAVRLSGDYLLSRRFPFKAISLLERAAADAAAEVALSGGDAPQIGRKDLAGQIATETGLPVETILGTGQDKDYSHLLSRNLVGQDHAVSKVANRLDLIQKGFVDKSRPAAIFLFAGLSGTGKTELAKQIASVYSSSHKIITYTMADFKEAHAVSRFIGTPPGYIGYDEGGKLVNDINKDPYSLILFDEVEKANPAIWDPLLNLFDEGVITDTRGVSAYANKTFFVMTSNIGQYDIVRMLREKKPLYEIEERIQDAVGEATYSNTGEKCFRPEFIGRIVRSGGIVIFNSLSVEAMEGITRHMAIKESKKFEEMRECKLEIDDEVITTIARMAHEENEVVLNQSKGAYLGGRRLNTLFDDMVLNRLAENIGKTANASLVRVVMDGNKTILLPITNDDDIQELLAKRRATTIDRVVERLDRIALIEPEALNGLSDEKLSRLDALLAEAGIMSGAS